MKRITAFFLTVVLCLSFVACGNSKRNENMQTTQPAAESTAAQESTQVTNPRPSEENSDTQTEEAVTEPNTQEGKTLVVYYSATGYTKEAASYIAAATGADTFELVPAEPYTSSDLDWTNKNSRVSREHDDPSLRAVPLVESNVEDWASYDTVFIGYPIWWGIAAWPVDSFIAANDFTGKTVIPFCTSSTSDLGESGALLAEAAGTGNWLEGQRFRSGVSEEEVKAWIAGLGL